MRGTECEGDSEARCSVTIGGPALSRRIASSDSSEEISPSVPSVSMPFSLPDS
jgi:hypothetical protein